MHDSKEQRELRDSGLTKLPAELVVMIIEFLFSEDRQKDLRNLSRTATFLCNAVAPYIFQSLVLTNSERSGTSLQAIANGSHASCVKNLQYVGSTYCKSSQNSDEAEASGPVAFPAAVESTLSNLDRFSKLRKVSIEFPLGSWEDEIGSTQKAEEQAKKGETAEEIQEAEETNAWRFLMAQTYNALAKNQNPRFQLQLLQLGPYAVSSFETEAFHKLMSGLRKLTVSLRDWDEAGTEYLLARGESMRSAAGFASKFDAWFFDHLESIRVLKVKAAITAPIGLEPGEKLLGLPFTLSHMPQLRSITVHSMFLCGELRDFLTERSDTLEVIVLVDCMAVGKCRHTQTATMPFSWCSFLNAIADKNPTTLRRFDVGWTVDTQWQYYDGQGPVPKIDADIDEIYAMLKADPDMFIFYYTTPEMRSYMVPDSWAMRCAAFQQDDQKAYRRLTTMAEKNKSELEKRRKGRA